MSRHDRIIKRDRRSAITAFLVAVASSQPILAAFQAPSSDPPVTTAGGRIALAWQEPGRLEPGATIKREIAGAEAHSYKVSLTRGQYLRLVAHQQGSDLSLKLYSPAGQIVAEVNQGANGSSSKPISIIAQLAGDYRLEITPLRKDAERGGYELSIDQLRPATPEDLKRHSAETLFAEADHLRAQRKAEDYHNRALAISEELKERGGQVSSLNNLAAIHLSHWNLQRALENHNKALELARAMKDQRGEARTLVRIGNVHEKSNNLREAIAVYGQALEGLRAISDKQWEAVALNGLGTVFHALGEHERAIRHFEQALSIWN